MFHNETANRSGVVLFDSATAPTYVVSFLQMLCTLEQNKA